MHSEHLASHSILGLQEGSSCKDAEKAYRELAKQYHPDKCAGNPEKFREIVTAKEYICNFQEPDLSTEQIFQADDASVDSILDFVFFLVGLYSKLTDPD